MPHVIKKIALVALLFLTFIGNSKGTHIYGAEFSYRALDSFVFEVHVTFYRNCTGVSFNNPSASVTSIDSGITKPMSLSLVSISEITPTTGSGGCIPQNTYGTGQGIERHIYIDTIDFNDSIYAALKSSCDIRFETSDIRNSLGQFQGGTFYNYASLNLCQAPNNSSPQLHYSPVNFLCCSQPARINPGARDTFNGDSLSYHFSPPLINRTNTSTYSGGVAYNNPFTVYYPVNLSYPYNNPNTNPPIGLYFNSKTGDLVFTPTNCSEVTTYVIEVKEWRKDTSGAYVEIGSIRRDIMSVINTCPTNEPPYFELESSYTICLGETLCLDIIAYDDPYQLPPPASSPAPDTTYISWNKGIPSASFKVNNDTGRLASGQFCWTPTEADVRSRPYYFVVEARDNATPWYARNQRAVEIKVAYTAEAEFTTENLTCGKISLNAQIDSGFSGAPAAYRWRVLDTSGVQLNEDYAYFTSDSSELSRLAKDTLKFKQNGTYILEGRVNNESNCPVFYYDTVEISGVFHTLLNVNDTIICIEDQLNLKARSFNDEPLSYTWIIDGQISNHTDSNVLYLADKLGNHQILVQTENAEGCTDFDQFSFNIKGIKRKKLQDSVFSCAEDVVLKADSMLTKVYWSQTDSSYTFTASQSGIYTYEAYDGYACDYFDTSVVTVFPLTPLELNDSTACEDEVDITIANYEEYNWSNGSTSNPVTVSNSGLLKVTVEDANGCIQTDSAQIVLHGKPILNLHDDTGFCCKSSSINLLTWLDSQDPNAGLWSNPQNPNSVQSGVFLYPNRLCGASTSTQKLFYTYTHPNTGCVFRDSVNVEIYADPVTSLNTGAFCQEEALVDLEELVHTPSIVTTELQWSCLDCSGFNFENLLVDQSTDTVPEYWLKIDEASYTVHSSSVDTLTLELLYTSPEGCTTRDTTTIQIGAKPDIPILSKQDEYITVTNPYSTVRWHRDGNWLSVVSDTVIDASFPGTYTARNVSSIGCLSDESDEIIRTIGVEELEKLGFTISPNPSDGTIKLHISEQIEPENLQIRIINALGQTIEFESSTESQDISIQWDGPTGNYLLEIKTPSGLYRFTLIKQD